MEISFIIPVYNGERCIGECIGEIQKWDKKEEIEIIVIDDGSDDGTWDVLNRAAENDGRIKVIRITNSGQGVARNLGFHAASGKYVYYADADDRANTEAIYKLYMKAEEMQADVAMGGYYRIGNGKAVRVHMPENGFVSRTGKPEDVERYHRIKTESAFGYVWNKLYRKSFLSEHNLYMDDVKKLNMEDFLFNLKVWSKAPSFYCTDYPVYSYMTDHISTTRNADPEIHIKSAAMLTELFSYLEKERVMEENLDIVIPLIARMFCWSLIKNIPYEGREMEQLRRRAIAFAGTLEIRSAAGTPGASKHLQRLPSLPQRIFYRFCLRALRRGKVGGVCMMFYLLYPVMRRYVDTVLK